MKLSRQEFNELIKSKPHLIKGNERTNNVSNEGNSPRKAPVMEPTLVDVSLGAPRLQEAMRPSFRVRITSVRERLLDEDNLAGKYLTDLCRSYRFIPDDNPAQTTIQTTQRKCEVNEPEHVEITIERINQ